MATINTCDVVGCTAPARKVRASLDTINVKGEPVGIAMEMDACDVHRIECYGALQASCVTALEAALDKAVQELAAQGV